MKSAYDITKAIKKIEDELIASMIRNLKRHKAEETKEGYNWSQWQVLQLKALDAYKRRNQKKYKKPFESLNKRVKNLLGIARQEGGMKQEEEILKAIENGFSAEKKDTMQGEFFGVNDRKLDSLVEATTHDLQKAETAVLRKADDEYRKIIFNAQVCANTGALTYEQAVDMATKDFLAAGIQCVEYSNGARHTLSDYADMAIRTASKRAYLQGEGQKRQEYDISTVILNKRSNPCPKCLPFVGKILIDDVWSGGPKDGISPETGKKYPLMSQAIAAGLYHPRCKDSHTTFYEGISTPPAGSQFTKEELEAIEENQRKVAKEQYAKRQEEKYERLAEHSLDPENQKKYAKRAEEWRSVTKPEFPPAATLEEAQQFAEKFCQESFLDKTFKGRVDYKGISVENANGINEALSEIYNTYDLPKINGIKAIDPKSAKGKKIFAEDAVAAYSPVEHGIYINKEILKNEKTLAEYNKRSKEAWDYVMDNMDTLSGSQREMAERYKAAGRSLVGDGSVKDYITHEIGHHVQWEAFDAKTNNAIGSKMHQYAGKISGYATASKSEYFAESFAAYMKGERDLLDPEFTDFLDAKMNGAYERVEKTIVKEAGSGIIKLSSEELGALQQYKSFESYVINDVLREDLKLTTDQEEFVKNLDSALSKMPKYEGHLIRTVDFSDWPDGDERTIKFVEGFIPGKKIDIKQYWSTSKNAGYSDTAEIEIYIQNAKNGRDVSSVGLDEQEVLYERNNSFIVISKDLNNGVWNILLEEA